MFKNLTPAEYEVLLRHDFGLGFDAVVTVRLRPETALGRILLDAAT